MCKLPADEMPQLYSLSSPTPQAAGMHLSALADPQGSAVLCLPPTCSNTPGRAEVNVLPTCLMQQVLLSCTRNEGKRQWDHNESLFQGSRCASNSEMLAVGEVDGEEPERDLQLSRSHGLPSRVMWDASGKLCACKPAAKRAQMFPGVLTSPASSPVTHLLIAAALCHIPLGSFLTDLK